MWMPITAALIVTVSASAAGNHFEGVIDSRITITGEEEEEAGTTRMYVASQGLRIESQTSAARGSVRSTTLFLHAKPGLTHILDDEKHTYVEQKRLEDLVVQEGLDQVSVKKLPGERVAGHDCAHALLVDGSGESTEVWVTRSIGGAETFWAAQAGGHGRDRRQMARTIKALRASGLDGWPLKWKTHPARAGTAGFAWEAIQVERKKLRPSLFSLSGYTRSEGGPGTAGQTRLSPQERKLLQDAMRKMPPERRQQLEEMTNPPPGGGAGSGKGD
jgi:hypothetical protein